MSRPEVRIELYLGEDEPTWVTVTPVSLQWTEGQEHYGVEEAAGIAHTLFLRSIIRDEDAVSKAIRDATC